MKKLRRDKVIEDLKLLAYGADGCTFELDDDEFPCLQRVLSPAVFARFAFAVREVFLSEYISSELLILDITSIADWSTFDTLADAIIKERKRLDSLASAATKETP